MQIIKRIHKLCAKIRVLGFKRKFSEARVMRECKFSMKVSCLLNRLNEEKFYSSASWASPFSLLFENSKFCFLFLPLALWALTFNSIEELATRERMTSIQISSFKWKRYFYLFHCNQIQNVVVFFFLLHVFVFKSKKFAELHDIISSVQHESD